MSILRTLSLYVYIFIYKILKIPRISFSYIINTIYSYRDISLQTEINILLKICLLKD